MSLRGAPYSEEAYAHAKMLDHSSWQQGVERLPRLVTASDIDTTFIPIQGAFVFDNKGKIVFAELTRAFANWRNVDRGQLWLYQACITASPHCAVICKHSIVPQTGRKINTRLDIEAFQVMLYDYGFVFSTPINGNERWQKFVQSWFIDPLGVRRHLLGRSIERSPLWVRP